MIQFVGLFWSQYTIYIGFVLFLLYKLSVRNYDFFHRNGIPYEKPIPFFGNYAGVILQTSNLYNLIRNVYMKYEGKRFFGLFELKTPILVIRDPDLIKQITVKDFDHFVDHRRIIAEKIEPLFTRSLFILEGQKWKDMRTLLSPGFTGSKIRQMFDLVVECSDQTTKYLLAETKNTDRLVLEMKDICTRLANDVIATCAFGIQVNSLDNKTNEFFEMGQKATNLSGIAALKVFIAGSFPKMAEFFNFRLFGDDQSRFYRSLVHDTMSYREGESIIRHDMIQLLMEAKKGTGIQSKRIWEDDDLTAQCMLFFMAGFDSVASVMAFAIYELTINPDIQNQLIMEVDEFNQQLNGKKISYDFLGKMRYLDMVLSETLRMWPPAIFTDRACAKSYAIKDDNGNIYKINKGDVVMIPIIGLHYDPNHFPNPDTFNPERFSDENKENIKSYSYLPFGAGPRNCLGSRFALMECKAFLFCLLSKFTLHIADSTQIPMKLGNTGFNLRAEKGIKIHLKARS